MANLTTTTIASNPDFWHSIDWRGLGEVLFYIGLSFICYRILQYVARWYLFGRCTFRTFNYFRWAHRFHRRPVPPSQSLQVHPPNKKWRISNEVVSLIHSVVSGFWALYVIVNHHVMDDMVYFRDDFALYLIYMSFGYILHDLVDLLINERSMRIIELLFHHVIVIMAFMTTLCLKKYLAVVVFGLLMELNSIFLHSRSLLNLYRHPKTSTGFKIIALLNVISFMIFRMVVSGYLLKWQITEAWSKSWYEIILTFVVIVSLAVTNTVLGYRVLAADGLLGKKHGRTPTDQKSEGEATNEDEEDEDYDDNSDDVESGNARVLPPRNQAESNATTITAAESTANGHATTAAEGTETEVHPGAPPAVTTPLV
uniref:TLC domain-containing protein n=1 Tax=Panagrellus redivivus TaxID=6233 RepID=A0A7E4ZUM0_PANRE